MLLERATRFAGGGSHQFNRFLAELATRADLFAAKAAHGLVGDGGVYRSESTFKLDKPQGWATRSYALVESSLE